MTVDTTARAIAAQARAAAAANSAAIALPKVRYDGSIVAMGDSITSNALQFNKTSNSSDSWLTKGIFTMLVARAGGRLRPVRVPGWPYGGSNYGGVAQLLVARGGNSYSPATTIAFDTVSGGTGAAATPVIQNGVIIGVTLSAPGANYAQAPKVTVSDSGGGSGAVLTAQLSGTGLYAVGGIGTPEMEAYIPLVLASGARNLLFMGGTNNNSRGIGLADSKASILSICQQLTAGGVRVIAIAPLDRSGANGSTNKRVVCELRRWFVDQLPSLVPGVVVADPTPFVSDPNLDGAAGGADGMPASHAADGLHPSSLGADAIAKIVWAQISYLFPGPGLLTALSTTWDQYDATYQPQGNLLGQAFVKTGTTATPGAGEAPWTGTRGNNVVLSRVTGGTGSGTIAASMEVRSDGRAGTRQVLTVNVSGAAQGEIYRLSWTGNGTAPTQAVGGANTLQVGDTLRGAIDELTMSNVAGLRAVKLKLVATNGTTITPAGTAIAASGVLGTAAWGDWEDANYPQWSGDTLFLQTRELVLPASSLGLTMHLDFVVNAGAASFTAKLFGASLRRIG